MRRNAFCILFTFVSCLLASQTRADTSITFKEFSQYSVPGVAVGDFYRAQGLVMTAGYGSGYWDAYAKDPGIVYTDPDIVYDGDDGSGTISGYLVVPGTTKDAVTSSLTISPVFPDVGTLTTVSVFDLSGKMLDTQSYTYTASDGINERAYTFTKPGMHSFTVTFASSAGDDVIGVDSLSFKLDAITDVQLIAIDSPLDNNPNTGGGMRLYPEKQTPTDAKERRTVKVRALTNLPQGKTVYFRSFDVDDPSSNTAPIDPNDAAGPTGNDNRGMPQAGTLSAASATSDANGVAEVTFTVTTQPGDNFRVVAGLDQAYLNGVVDTGDPGDDKAFKDSSGQALPALMARSSKMLTVWRHVHFEVDAMDKVTGNNLKGTITNAVFNMAQMQTILQLSQTPEIGRFENGDITIATVGHYPVVSYFGKLVRVAGNIAAAAKGKDFTLVDDDDMSDTGMLTGDEGKLVNKPDTSLMQDSDTPASNVFAIAYVHPLYNLNNTTTLAPFTLNSTQAGLIANYKFDNIATEADAAFWTVYLLGAYQFEAASDGDPNSEGITYGIVDNINGIGANVFQEAVSKHELDARPINRAFKSNAATSAHEIGHLFNGLHGDLGLMSQSGSRTTTVFSDVTIDKIRSLLHP